MTRRAAFAAATLLWIFAACVGEDPNTSPPGSTGTDGGDNPADAASSSDATDPPACASSCKTADIAVDCAGVERACSLGCSPELKACRTFDPAGSLTGGDLAENAAESAIDLPTTNVPTIVDTATGLMQQDANVVRAANVSASARETLSGVTFERRDGVAIFHAKSWVLRNVLVQGDLPVAFVASGDVKVDGYVSTKCGQAGGAPTDFQVSRPGNGNSGTGSGGGGGASGGGGGGHGTAGGKGATSTGDDDEVLVGGAGGPAFTFDVANPRGGGRGGSGANGGGAGGGVVIIASGTTVRVGDGVLVTYTAPATGSISSVRKGINVGGCGGSGGRIAGGAFSGAGSGGGAGGLIVVEAPTVLIDANAGLAANGGGGGGTDTVGSDARLDDAPPNGGNPVSSGGCAVGAYGGKGAAGESAAQEGVRNTPACGEYEYGGGGGGGGGRIIIRNKAGNVSDRAPSSILSPAAGLDVAALTTN